MMSFVESEEYRKIVRGLKLNTRALIDGKLVEAKSGRTFETRNPATGTVIANVACCDAADVDEAVAAARRTFESGVWSRMNPSDRKKILLRFAAESVDKLNDEVTPTAEGYLNISRREPIGVCAAILPWNFPILMAAWKLAPILSAGNSAVAKPAKLTSLTLLKLAELSLEAGIPAGVFNVVPGSGGSVGDALANHMDIDLITFTGSTDVGRKLLNSSGSSNLKRVLLELGGKSPCIVMPDIGDLDFAARQITAAGLWNMGENCTQNSRIMLHRDIKERLLPRTKIVKG